MTTPLRRLTARSAVAAVVLAWLWTGCGTATRAGPPATYNFDIIFRADPADPKKPPCPREVVVVETDWQCRELLFFRKKDCLRAQRQDTVIFTARLEGQPGAARELDFSLDFDPFRTGSIPSKDGRLDLTIDSSAPAKTYTYNVNSGRCPPHDPTIIIEK